MKISLNQRRFLIVWILFHSFALFVNIAQIQLNYSSPNNDGGRDYTYIFTKLTDEEKFWPFTDFRHYVTHSDTSNWQEIPGTKSHMFNVTVRNDHYFDGIFNSYGFSEYIFYVLFGFVIIYIPRLWRKKEQKIEL
jgi:hypothetical protein